VAQTVTACSSVRTQDAASLRAVFQLLLTAYGQQHWWPGDSPFEVIVGAILTQQTAWANVEKALANLGAAGALSPDGIRATSEGDLAALIRPSGFYRGKARKLTALVALLDERFGGDLNSLLAAPGDELRAALLATHGIGPETADSILLYAAGRPYFVIDAYTRRIFSRLGVTPERDTYEAWQAMFTQELPPDSVLFNEYHALIVEHAKRTCRTVPLCQRCVLLDVCPAGRAASSTSA
jgi:endonuclease III related protein